jgi:uncharacterized protein DUF2742
MTTQPIHQPAPTDLRAVRAWLAARQPDLSAVRAWVLPLLAAANRYGPIPDLGGPAWRDLPNSDPRKLAALIRPALAWLAESTPAATAARLRRELDDIDTVCLRRLRMASQDLSTGFDSSTVGPSYAELVRRRNTFPCTNCRRTPVLYPQSVCQRCQETREVAA